jgi:phenylpropionate dioxygenase-like ring-hydroxylating dioxygenase large terminal subunit
MNKPEQVLPARKWTHDYPWLGTGPLPHTPNISAEYFERERERIFKRCWLLLCREDEVPTPASYAVKQIPILHTSVLLTRGQDGVVRAFHNVCRHRGNKVVMGEGEKRGDAPAFMCGFHGWTYDLEGRLIQVPDEEDFFGLDKCQLGLKPIHCGVWRGFVFINVADEPKETLKQAIGRELAEDIGGFPFEAFELVNVYSTHVRCNWKIGLDAFQEGYHAIALHRKSAYAPFATPENPYLHLLYARLYAPGHRRISFPANIEYQPTPSVAAAVKFAGNNVYAYKDASARHLPGVNPTGAPNWSFDATIVFPHVQVLMSDAFYVTQHFWPVSVDETYWELRQYLPRSTSVASRISQQQSQSALRDVIREDLSTLENTQTVLKSGAIPHMQLNDSEIAVRYSYYMVDKYVRGDA